MILGTLSLSTAYQVSGATIYTGRILYAKLSEGISFLHTSNPVSKLLTASCNPLSADEILSITVLITYGDLLR